MFREHSEQVIPNTGISICTMSEGVPTPVVAEGALRVCCNGTEPAESVDWDVVAGSTVYLLGSERNFSSHTFEQK
jgi:hypothetical protein